MGGCRALDCVCHSGAQLWLWPGIWGLTEGVARGEAKLWVWLEDGLQGCIQGWS